MTIPVDPSLGETLSSQRGFDGAWIHVRVDRVQLPSGRVATREVVEHPGAVAIVAITRDGTRHLLEETLAAVEAAADPARFFRVNRQMIVSIDAVRRFVPEGKGRLALELSPPAGVPVSVSQERAAAFRAWLAR